MISLDETIAQRLANYSVTEKLEYCKETVLNSLEQWKRVSDQTAVTIEVILSYLGQDASIPPETLYQWRQALDTHPDANRIDQARSQAKRYLAQYEITNTRLKKLWNGKGFEDLEPGDTVFPVRAMPMIMKMAETTGFEDVSGRLERQKDRRLAAGRSKRTTIQPRDVQAVLQDLQVKDAASAKQLSSPLNQSVPIDHQPMSTSTNRMSSAMKPDLVDQPTLNHSTAGPSKQSPFSDESFAYRNLADDELDTSTTRQPLPIPHTSMDQPVPVNASTSSYQASCIDQAIPTNGASSANQASPTSHPTAAPDGARPTSPKPLRKRRKAVDGTYHGLNKPQRKSPGRRWSTSSSDSNVSSTASIELPRKDQTSLSKADELMDERDITAVGLVSDEVSHTQDQDAVEKNRTAIETTDGWSDLADLPAGVFPEDGASMLGGTLDGPSSPISPPSRSVSPRLPSHSPSIDAAAQRRALQERELETLKSAEGRLDDRLLMKLLDLEVKDSEPVMLIDTLQSKLTATAIPSQPRRSRAKKSVLLLLPHHCPESELWVLYVFFPSTKRLEYYDSLYDADRRERHLAPIQACLSRLLDEECICRATTGQCAQQSNAVDCGIYLLEAVDDLVNGRDVSTDLDPTAARMRWAHKLETFNQQQETEMCYLFQPSAALILPNFEAPANDESLSVFDESLRTSFASQSSARQTKYTECERDHKRVGEEKQRCHRGLLESKQRLGVALRQLAYAQQHVHLARDAEQLSELDSLETFPGAVSTSITGFRLALRRFLEAAEGEMVRARNVFSAAEKGWTEALEKARAVAVAKTEAAQSLSRWREYISEIFRLRG